MTPCLTLLKGEPRLFGKANRVGTTCVSRPFEPRQRVILKRSNSYVAVPYYNRGWTRHNSNQRFYREIVGWKYVLHPNVVPFLGVSETLFPFSIITPWFPNGNIAEYVQKHEGVDRLQLVSDYHHLHKRAIRDFFLDIQLAQATRGLEYLHSLSIVHSNVTPVRDSGY